MCWGKALRGQAREMVCNVYNHIKEQNNNLKYTAAEATSDATVVSNSFVKLIAAEGKQATAQNTLQFSTSTGKNSTRRNRI